MKTVLSHIVQKRFSTENENIATEALAFIMQSSEAARSSLIKLLRGIAPDLPSLRFQTQQTEENVRPDMWGLDGSIPRVFIENKFWAGLTDNQPVAYLKLLAKYEKPSILLVVVPSERQETVWRELLRRLFEANISTTDLTTTSDIPRAVKTDSGPLLALTSWIKLLSAIEVELTDEPQARSDLLQLRALCDAADSDAIVPISSSELTNQGFPALVLQLNSIVQGAVDLGITGNYISTEGLRPIASWDRIGRYVSFPTAKNTGAWFGTSFSLWRKHGGTPLWLIFPSSDWGRAHDVRAVIEPWAGQEGIFTTMENDQLAIGIKVITGEELDNVVGSVANLLQAISVQLSKLQNEDTTA